MARIRTIKPELFTSEDLARVSLTAERTFVGLLTQADDRGRFRDHPAVIAGLLWVLRPEHTAVHVEADLGQLADAGLICRYTGCNGKPYLHITGWDRHQHINRPSASRVPACPTHPTPACCPTCKQPACVGPGADLQLGEGSVQPQGGFTEPSVNPQGHITDNAPSPAPAPGESGEPAGQSPANGKSGSVHGGLPKGSVSPQGPDLGPRNMDLGSGSIAPAEREAPAPDTATVEVEEAASGSAHALVARYVRLHEHRPPERVLGQIGQEVRKLLNEGFPPDRIAAGLHHLADRGLHPSTLASAVNQAMSTRPHTGAASRAPGHRGWANPADVQAAYGGDL